ETRGEEGGVDLSAPLRGRGGGGGRVPEVCAAHGQERLTLDRRAPRRAALLLLELVPHDGGERLEALVLPELVRDLVLHRQPDPDGAHVAVLEPGHRVLV